MEETCNYYGHYISFLTGQGAKLPLNINWFGQFKPTIKCNCMSQPNFGCMKLKDMEQSL